jgi:guanosine-3',5'-bis(diphosphate) 3'-pyrophosphohydrolase
MTYPRPPGYELFFAPLEIAYDPNTCERIEFAYFCSKLGHAFQKRDDGTPYFDHPKAAAWIYIDELEGRDPELIIDILLHDIQEDSYLLSPYRITLNFGAERARDVRALTKLSDGKETIEEYLQRVIARGPRTIVAKLCDNLHNIRTVKHRTEEKRRKAMNETEVYLLPQLTEALKKFGPPWDDLAEKLFKKISDALFEGVAARL